MIKKGKYICSIAILLLLALCVVGSLKTSNATGLVAMPSSQGGDLKYRNSSETVYMLEEYNYPTSQLRAVWVSAFVGDISAYTTEEAFKTELNGLLDNLESMGMNAMVFHLRTHNNALYDSDLNPLASWFANVNFDEFDPITWLIDECHSRGIEFHAWLNPYRITKNGDVNQFKAEEMDANNPGSDLNNCITVSESIILDPGIPSNQEFIIDTCMEIIEKYDVDAIHFDDYFYISGADDTATRAKYNTSNLSVADFRRKSVDTFIENLSKEMRAYNAANGKTVQLGIAPSGIYKNGGYSSSPSYDANGNLLTTSSNTSGFAHYGDYLYADTLKWINNEWIDYIMPQLYWATEHTNASFAELTRWWSWAVRYKKVNFYAGIGIYMALSPDSSSGAYWVRHDNEVQRQLLYAGQYAEFAGACFYKYDYLLKTYNSVVAHGVDLISNDYWAKRVPGAVQKYYAPLMAEITPTNVKYLSVNKTITYDSIENVRGYMIYQVPKGTTLDKANIDHVYKYIQDTSVQITDTVNYDYYVASVNLANEVSEAVYINIDLSGESIIDLINSLPEVITIDNMNLVEDVRKKYNMLSEDAKALVTNIAILEEREQQANNIKQVNNTIEQFILKLDTHVKTNRVLPKLSNMTWSYKTESDASLYNITTGERLKNYLATKEITLLLTITENNVTITKEVNINIGYVATTQTGLFYRNDPSCMNEDDDGEYDSTMENKWIGWSGHTVVIGNEVLFIAYGNYLEITDPSNIVMTNWKSCAGVYVNKTQSDVSLYLTQAFESYSSNYDGYFIISTQGTIKTIVTGFDTSVPVTIEKGESLVIIRYLDGSINGAPWAPVTKLTVGMGAYIDEEPTLTNEDKATEFINKINDLPDVITLEHELIVNELMAEYANLSSDIQVLITNYNKLESAYNEIQSQKLALQNAKNEAISIIETYVDLSNYSESNQTIINSYIKTAKTNISLATSTVTIDAVVLETKQKIDAVESLSDLNEAKEEYKAMIDTFVAGLDYSQGELELIEASIPSAKSSIDNATTIATVKQLYEGYIANIENNHISLLSEIQKNTNLLLELIDEGKTKSQQEYIEKIVNDTIDYINTLVTANAVQEYAFNVKDELHMYISEINNQIEVTIELIEPDTTSDNELLVALANEYIEYVTNAQTVANVESLYSEYLEKKEQINNPVVDLTENKLNAKQEITTYINTTTSKYELTFANKLMVELNKVVLTYITNIENAETEEQINQAVLNAKNAIDTYVNNLNTTISIATEELNAKINLGKTISQKTYIAKIVNEAIEYINTLVIDTEINTYVATKELEIDNYITSINETIEEVNELIKLDITNDNEQIVSLANEYMEYITNAQTIAIVESLYSEYVAKKDNIVLNKNKELTKQAINEYIQTLEYSQKELVAINSLKEEMFSEIDKYTKLADVNNALNKFKETVHNYHVVLQTKINSSLTELNKVSSDDESIKNLIKQTTQLVKEAGTTEEVDQIMEDYEKEYAKLTKPTDSTTPSNPNNGCSTNCASSTVLQTLFISCITCIFVLFRRKTRI